MLNMQIIRETHMKTIMRYHLTPLKMVIIKKSRDQRADNRSKKNYNPAAYGPKTTVTERQRR